MKECMVDIRELILDYNIREKIGYKDMFNHKSKKRQVFRALKNITLTIDKGKVIGIIGSNGSGKSTLLKVIAGVYEPTSGVVDVKTDKVSLLSLGLGFNDELTGLDNIYLNASLLGLRKREIDEKLEDIIKFSEIGDFIYQPVKTYSSGMKSKLTFAIAINIEPELLLLDEIFSVGDIQFKKKSEKKIIELIKNENVTVVMVSHSLGRLKKVCSEVVWLEKGEIRAYGDAKQVIEAYQNYMDK